MNKSEHWDQTIGQVFEYMYLGSGLQVVIFIREKSEISFAKDFGLEMLKLKVSFKTIYILKFFNFR